MFQDDFKFYKPCKLLQPYIRHYCIFKTEQPLNTFTFPLGCPQIIFHKQMPLYIPELKTMQSKLTISGQVNFSSHLYAEGNIEMIAIVFHPHAMSLFLGTPTSLFYNQEVSGYDIGDKSLEELASKISECEDSNINIKHIDNWLLSRVIDKPSNSIHKLKRIEVATKQIYTTPQTSVTELSSITCLSKKQFEREFQSHIGMNPREYTRIVRFQKALAQMQHQLHQINLAQIAYASGYADQSHFIREFKRLCGHTPTSLLKFATPYSDLFTNPI